MFDIKEIKELIKGGNVIFTVEGITTYKKDENDEWGNYLATFKVSDSGDAVYQNDDVFGMGMNIAKIGPTCITLFTYNMLGKKTTGKIKYTDITILK